MSKTQVRDRTASQRWVRVAPQVYFVADREFTARARLLTRMALRVLPRLVIGNSEATVATAGLSPSRAVVIHDPYRAHPSRKSTVERCCTLGMVGRLAPWKGQDVFLRAFAAAFDDSSTRARIVGSALFGEEDYAADLRVLADELGIADRVTFVGFTADVEDELAGFDVLVHASVVPEPFGQVIVEGMAAGLAVVASDAGGPREIITDGVDGLLVEPGDPYALGRALRRLADDPALRSRLGAAALTRAADFAPEAISPQLMAASRHALRP